MINNNKGAILLVTIVSMMILTIIGYITLQMTSSQGVTDTYEQARIRTEYAAEGIVERAKGYIEYIVNASSTVYSDATPTEPFGDVGFEPHKGTGFLYSKVKTSLNEKWKIFEDDVHPLYGVGGNVSDVFDSSMYPHIRATVWVEFVDAPIEGAKKGNDLGIHKFTSSGDPKKQTYKLVGVASTTVNASDVGLIVSTVTYYFNTTRVNISSFSVAGYRNDRTTLIWRKENIS